MKERGVCERDSYCSEGLQIVQMRVGSWDAPVKRSAALSFWMGGSIRED